MTSQIMGQKRKLDAACFTIPDLNEHRNKYFLEPKYNLIILDGEKLISCLEIYEIETKWKDKTITIGGIGSVMTDSLYRNKGLAKDLLQKALEIMGKEKYDFSLLQTDVEKATHLYGSIGFIPMKKEYTFITKDGKLDRVKAKDTMILPLANPEVTADILNSAETLFVGNGSW
ncbi:MAG: GNAT family N-acetyltransferase [bacterium]|nr:GNAT family N-acetyltransferase [bacterium]